MDVSPRSSNPGTLTITNDSDPALNDTPTQYPHRPECGVSAWGEWTVKANANSGYTFDHWVVSPTPTSGLTNTKSNPAIFSSDKPYALTAYFTSGSSVSVPSAPTNVLASDGTYNDRVRISWSASSGATSYEINRDTDTSGFSQVIGTTTSLFFDDTTVTSGTTYYYWVRAINSAGASGLSSYNIGYSESGGVDPPVDPPIGGVGALTATQAKAEIDETLALVILDIRENNDYLTGHLLCAENAAWNSAFSFINYNVVANYKDIDILIYDQDGTNGLTAANYLASEGFSTVYYISGGLNAWEAKGYETVTMATPCSVPPMADAGEDQTAFENAAVVLDGSDSSSTWVPLTYLWSYFSGPHVVLLNPTTAKPTFTAPSVQEGGEEIIFHLKVINAQQVADTDSVSVFVTWNQTSSAPVAYAGANKTVNEKVSVTLNATATDPDNDIETYSWTQIGTPSVNLSNANSKDATFTAPDVSTLTTLTFRVTVTDAEDNSDTDDVQVTINNVEDPVDPAAPVADAGDPAIVDESTTVTLDGSDSYAPSGTIAAYQWTQTSGTNVGSIAATATPSFTAPSIDISQEILTFELVVTNNTGHSSLPDTVSILVKDVAVAVGHRPVADAGSLQTVYGGATVTLNGSMSKDGLDSDGAIVSYQWQQISGEDVTLSDEFSPNPTFVAPILDDMTMLVFDLTVTDNDGHQDTDDVTIIVDMTPPPVADAGDDQVVKENKTVALDGSGSTDAGDGIKSYFWEQISGIPVAISATDLAQIEFEAPKIQGGIVTLIFDLTVENYSGLTSTDMVAISVKNSSSDDSTCFISAMQ